MPRTLPNTDEACLAALRPPAHPPRPRPSDASARVESGSASMDEPKARTSAHVCAAHRRRNGGHRRGFSAVMPAVVRAVRQKEATAMHRNSFPTRSQLNLSALSSAGSGAMGFYGDQGRRNSASNIPMGEVEMALGKTAIKGGLAALMVAAMSAGAFAWDAVATTS